MDREIANPKRILFLFNHDAAHQAAHVAGIMASLARCHPEFDVIAAVGTPQIERQIRGIIGSDAAGRLDWVDLSLSSGMETLLAIPNRILPATRLARLRAGEELFASVDMIVSPERTCLRVKDRLSAKGKAPLFVFVPHGAGDRSVTYHPSIGGFDYHLVSGQKVQDEMIAHGLTSRDRCPIIGYAKFDTVAEESRPRLFDNEKPTILYNPHFDPRLSSWYTVGPQLLEALAGMDGAFNLVFAPHVMLWRKRLHISPEYRVAKLRPDVPEGIGSKQNVIIDTASPALFDMTYTSAADIYVGDVSSQIYEFLRRPKPSIFIDAAGDGPDAYPFWANGPVVRTVEQVVTQVMRWQSLAFEYRDKQEELFRYTIDHDPDRSASDRGAEAIAQILV